MEIWDCQTGPLERVLLNQGERLLQGHAMYQIDIVL